MGIAYNTSIVRDGMVMHLDAANVKSYPGSGTVWKDLSGNANDGNIIDSPVYSLENKGYFQLDGINDYISFSGYDSFLTITGDITLETSFTHNNASGGIAGLLQVGNYTGTYMSNSNLSIQTNGDNSGELVALEENKWYHTVCTFESGTQYKIYVNGALESTVSTTDNSYSFSETGFIGRRVNSASEILQGKVADAKIYNRALSANEVSQNFEALRGRYGI